MAAKDPDPELAEAEAYDPELKWRRPRSRQRIDTSHPKVRASHPTRPTHGFSIMHQRWGICPRRLLAPLVFGSALFFLAMVLLIAQDPTRIQLFTLGQPEALNPECPQVPGVSYTHNSCEYGPEVRLAAGQFPLKPLGQPRKVWVGFMFNQEWPMLEIMLHTLNETVDGFILVESPATLKNEPKPLHFQKSHVHHSAILPFLPKITHVVFDPDHQHQGGGFEDYTKEKTQRKEGILQGLRTVGVTNGDLVVVCDADEMPKPWILEVLKTHRRFPPRLSLRADMYLHSFEFLQKDPWTYPHVITWDERYSDDFVWVRSDKGFFVADSAIHCTGCFFEEHQLEVKWNAQVGGKKRNVTAANFKEMWQRMCNGQIGFQGWGSVLVQTSNHNLPRHVAQNLEHFRELLPGRHCGNSSPVWDI